MDFYLVSEIWEKNHRNVSKNVSSKYSQKPLYHAKQSAIGVLKTASKKAIQKTAEATGDLTGNKIAEQIKQKSQKLHHRIIQKQL